MKRAVLLLLAGAAFAGDGAKLFYSRDFPGSVPAYFDVSVTKDGDAAYRESVDDDQPVTFRLAESETREIFLLADKLDHFKRSVESPAKVAFTGAKIFRYEDGAESNQVKFNYSDDASARALQDWFERIAESAQLRTELERAAKYDHLGVVKALTLLADSLNRKRLVGMEQYLPTLVRISNGENYMHTARVQAAAIADAIRKQRP